MAKMTCPSSNMTTRKKQNKKKKKQTWRGKEREQKWVTYLYTAKQNDQKQQNKDELDQNWEIRMIQHFKFEKTVRSIVYPQGDYCEFIQLFASGLSRK
jgi:hypothetical protein